MAERTKEAALVAWLGPPWSGEVSSGPGGMEIAGFSATQLAARFGTPLLVFDEAEIRDRCRSLRARYPRVLYAVKAFTAHAMLRIALEEGLDLLASSGGEVDACLRAGAPPSRIVMHGSNKTDTELASAVRAGISLVVVDHVAELIRLDAIASQHGRVQPILLRVVPEVRVQTHESIATGHDSAKFGTSLRDADAVVRAATAMDGIRFEGLHAHIGSQVLDVAPYLETVNALVDLAAGLRRELDVTTSILDLGGGFGVRYLDEEPLVPEGVAAVVSRHLADRCGGADLEIPTLVLEPGRSLVANAGLTLYRVGSRKEVGRATGEGGSPRTLLGVDGGMSDNLRPMLYDATYAVAMASASAGESRATSTFAIVGRHCESGDTLAEDVELPDGVGPGDLLAFAATGAYTYPLANNYNQVGRPAVVGVGRGRARSWIRREDAGDLGRLDAVTPRVPEIVGPPPGISIRPAAPRDAASFLEFWSEVVAHGGFVRSERVAHPARVYRRRFRRPWTDRDVQVVAVDAHERVVGHIYVQRERHPVTRHVATLGIAVAADHRGLGIGSALLSEGLAWARSVGVEKIVLSVYPTNTRAIALYRKFGFVQEGRLARQSRKSTGYQDEILMGAWIGPGAETWDER